MSKDKAKKVEVVNIKQSRDFISQAASWGCLFFFILFALFLILAVI